MKILGHAMTVLACAKCRWRVWVEGHHNLRGRKRSYLRKRNQYSNTVNRLLSKPLKCPGCGCPHWSYIRTEVADTIITKP